MTLEFTIIPGRSDEIKSSRVVELVKSKSLKDQFGNSFETSCGDYRILSWGGLYGVVYCILLVVLRYFNAIFEWLES